MPFTRIKGGKFRSPSGRVFTAKQVKLYYAKKKRKKKHKKKKKRS